MEKYCCFFGHKFINKKNLDMLVQKQVEFLILNDTVNSFLFGGYGDFDSLCFDVVRKLQTVYPHIKTTYVQAYYNPNDKEYADYLRQRYGEILYPEIENKPKKFAIVYRNQAMIDMSDFCIFYVDCDWGGAYSTLQYAKRKKKNIINLGE